MSHKDIPPSKFGVVNVTAGGTVFNTSESLSSQKEGRRPNGCLLHFRNFRQRPQLISKLTTTGHKPSFHPQWKSLAAEGRGCPMLRVSNSHQALDKEIKRDDIRGIFSTIQLTF